MTKLYRIVSRSLLILLCALAAPAFSQDRTVSGSITSSDDGSALPGANILEKGTTNGTVSDAAGHFSITTKENAVLIFSFIGYATQEISVGTQSNISIALSPDIATLSEVVVVGYGSVKKSDATGSLATVDTKAFNKGVVNSPQELLMGKTAGVVVTSNSGAPGNTSTILIRGGSSLGASNAPLIIIDGVPISNDNLGGSPNILSTINPNDIATFTVLKDASATAIYGLRASNGVILITTKRGSKDFQINYTGTLTLATAPRKVEVFGADEYRKLVQQYYPDQVSLLGDADTDWQNEIYKKAAFSHDHNVTVTGTTLKTPYRVSLGYNNSDGILKTYNFNRTTAAIGLDPTFFNNKLKVNINAKGMVNNNNFSDQSAIGGAIGYDPTKPVFNGNTRWRGYTTWTGGGINGTPNVLAAGNPVAKLNLTDNTSTVMRSIGNIKFDYELPLIKNLHATLNLGYDYTDTKGHNNVPDSTQWITIPGGGQRNEYSGNAKNQLLDFYMTYSPGLKSINSKVEVMGGYSWSHFYRYRYSVTTNFYNDEDTKSGGIPNPSEYYLISLFGRLNYTFKDKYLFTATLRSDATSRFSRDLRNGIFPSMALGWKLKQEAFLKDSKIISDLKLRAGYGKTGQQDTGIDADYPYLATYTLSDNASRYQLGNTFVNTYRPDAFNNKIKWETTETYNLGFDFGFVENKITGSLDFYQRKSIDLIVKSRTAKGTNFGSEVYTNIGNVTNKGVELNINAEVVAKENLQWIVGYNVAYNSNKVTKVTASNDPDYFISSGGLGCSTCGFIQAQKIGSPRNAFAVYQQVYNSEGKPLQDVYVDRNKDGIVNESDRYIYKKPDPTVLMGINSRTNYKNWDISFAGRVSLGNYVYNSVAAGSTYSSLYGVNSLSNTSTQALKTNFKDASLERFSDFYIENASFFRMDNINLGYTFEKIFSLDWRFRLGAGVQNVFVITKYSGIDPEIAGGIDNNFFPRTRSYFINFNWQF